MTDTFQAKSLDLVGVSSLATPKVEKKGGKGHWILYNGKKYFLKSKKKIVQIGTDS